MLLKRIDSFALLV